MMNLSEPSTKQCNIPKFKIHILIAIINTFVLDVFERQLQNIFCPFKPSLIFAH